MRKLKKEIWPYSLRLNVRIDSGVDIDILDWSRSHIGKRFRDWYSYSFGKDDRIYAFRDSETLLVFKLKWGQYVIR